MAERTKMRLIAAASDALDAGGIGAVTLRGVGEAAGVSHNAPYRHFRDRSALLAAVAERDFGRLTEAFHHVGGEPDALGALRAAALALVAYARAHPARYRLLFSDPDLLPGGGSLETAALRAFRAFETIVARCQAEARLQPGDARRVTGLVYATLHGAIDLELGGRAKEAKGLGDVTATIDLLLELLVRRA